MKIKFRQTGGFAGLTKSVVIDCDRVSAEEAETLKGLVDQSRFFDISIPVKRTMPDVEQYSITVEAEGRSRDIHMNSTNVPDDLKPLVKYISRRAEYEKRK